MTRRHRACLWHVGVVLSVLALLGLMLAGARAGGCYPSYGYSSSYSYGSYYPSYSYYQPSYYQPTYYPAKEYVPYPVYHKVEYEVQVPYAKPVFINKDYYYSLQDEYRASYRDNILAEAAAYKALLLQTQMANAGQGGGQGQGATGYYSARPGQQVMQQQSYQPPAPQQPQSAQAPGPQDGNAPSHAPGGMPVQTDVSPALAQLVTSSCLTCHGDSRKPNRMDLRSLGTMSVGDRYYMLGLVEDGTMPQGREPISNDGVKLFREHATKAHKLTARR
jgi:hypothetical protein